MANHSYLSFWFSDFTIEKGLSHLEALLTLFPTAATRPDLQLTIRSLDPTQVPIGEYDVLGAPASIQEIASQCLHDDTSYQVTTYWDLWQPHPSNEQDPWELTNAPVEILLQGEHYDNGQFRNTGHAFLRLGLEHLFTGHASILSGAELRPEDFTNRAEYDFMFALQEPKTLASYRSHICENIRTLHNYLLAVQKGLPSQNLPIERHLLWSEGEKDFAARTAQIIAGIS